MKKLFLCFALVGMASTLCAQERGDMLVSGSLSWSSSSTKTTVIKQDGDNKVSNRDFSLGLNVGATIACLASSSPAAPGSGRGIIPGQNPETM